MDREQCTGMQLYAPLNTEPQPLLQKIELATFFQLPGFHLVGLPGPEVSEARERVRSAMQAQGFEFPKRRVVINLSPASVRKRGTGADLAIALAILHASSGASESASVRQVAAWGELGLDGSVKSCGQLTRSLYAAYQNGVGIFILPETDYSTGLRVLALLQQTVVPPVPTQILELIGVRTLAEAWKLLHQDRRPRVEQGESRTEPVRAQASTAESASSLLPLSPTLERILGVSMAGGHHLLLLGPRGVGKSHAMEWAVQLAPTLSPQAQLSRNLILEMADHSSMQSVQDPMERTTAPVRRVSSQVRPAALIGGVTSASLFPGEFSLAHGGVLLADELPEWQRDSREIFREPLERGKVTLTRAQGSFDLPAEFQLIANGNLCPCGGWPIHIPVPTMSLHCRCTPYARNAYHQRLSGPILDRVDLVVLVLEGARVTERGNASEGLECLKTHVRNVRSTFEQRWGCASGRLSSVVLEKFLDQCSEVQKNLAQVSVTSLRSRHKILRVALSLAAWDGLEHPTFEHFLEAASYRGEQGWSF